MKIALVLAPLLLCSGISAALPPPCDPVPVKKNVSAVRREITVSIIGAERPKLPPQGPSVEACLGYWMREMNREIVNKPDLVVLPECIDSWLGATRRQVRDWVVNVRGDAILKAFQAYAREHRCYLVFNSHRQRKDGRFANCTFTIDRDGDVVGVYDKVYPTIWEIDCPHLTVVPGKRPVAVETDFGRLSFATCFDLNFRDLMEATAELEPDVIAFCSAYHGGFWQRAWALTCRSYLIAATLGHKAKNVWGPSGEALFNADDYYRTATVKINTNYTVCHLDYNMGKLRRALDKYAPRLTMRDPGSVGCVTLLSDDPELKTESVVAEFGLERLSDYYRRSVRRRGGEVPRTAE